MRPAGDERSARSLNRLLLVLSVAVLVAGLGTFAWMHFLAAPVPMVSTRTQITVVNGSGSPLPNRLVVVFLNGKEVARTDASGTLRGQFPVGMDRAIGDHLSLREGAVQPLTFPPQDQVLAYAFPGDSLALPFEVRTCRLALWPDGRIVCPDEPAQVPAEAGWLMGLLLTLLLFPVATLAVRHVNPWPREVSSSVRNWASYFVGTVLAVLVVVMFVATGVTNRWSFELTGIFSGAVDVIIAAIAASVGVIMFFTRVRSAFVLPR